MAYECKFCESGKYDIRLLAFQLRGKPDAWVWSLTGCRKLAHVCSGATDTKISAQVAAQVAFEHWLQLTGRAFGVPHPSQYDWNETKHSP
jgi:hypothetical protein